MDIRIKQSGLKTALNLLEKLPEFDALKESAYYEERLRNRPHLILVAIVGDEVAGCKIGYDRFSDGSFYSWLGGVLPDYRKSGIARSLADEQETWAKRQGYDSIRFKTQNRHKAMLQFALRNGFAIYNVKPNEHLDLYRIELIKELR